MKGKLGFVITLIALYLVSSGVSYGIFRALGPKNTVSTTPDNINPGEGFQVDNSAPKTEACPLNGKLYTKQEKAIWEKRRPLAIMVENTPDARPQSGISKSDIIYEAVAEGGITRFMAVNYCGIAEKTEFAPVRSARTYFVDWVSEYDALYNHVGGAGVCSDNTVDTRAKALCQIGQYDIKDMDQFGISFPTCFRNPDRVGHPVATEHQMVCVTDGLYKIADQRGWGAKDKDGKSWTDSYTPWKFKEDGKDHGTVAKIDMGWWAGYKDYNATWDYDTTTNEYKRSTGGQPHMDNETSTQLTAKNVVVQFSKETGPVDTHKHMLYETVGSGDALIFMDGNVTEGTWAKKSRTARTIYKDDKGKEVTFNPGVIWIEIIPDGNTVTY